MHPDVRFNAGPHNGPHLGTAYSHARRAATRCGLASATAQLYAGNRRAGMPAARALHLAKRGNPCDVGAYER